MVPCFGGTQRCPNLIGPSHSRELLYRGNLIEASQALEWGLVDEIVPYPELLAKAQEWASDLTVKSAFALQQVKKSLASRGEDFALEQKLFANCYRQKGIKQRVLAWLGQHLDELPDSRLERKNPEE
ncbi:MAG TPA: hypothetical protein DD435_13180 [Cyanobacteria bacterium UBA8530]|nr:hypothetical protein [Cyanobacteria bacterium UBA8530]